MKALLHGKRPHAGFEWEDRIAGRLSRDGHEVVQMPRNFKGYDLLVDGHLRVDVKACIHTSYKGSDGYHIRGWVFSNLHNPPTCDLYVLVCLDRTRQEPEKFYIIPASAVMQRTVTITKRDKYMAYKNAWGWVKKMSELKKEATLVPISFEMPQPARRGDRPFDRYEEPNPQLLDIAKRLALTVGGGYLGHEIAKTISPANRTMGAGLGAALGMAAGRQLIG